MSRIAEAHLAATRFWLIVGTPQNWQTAFVYGGIWGLRPSHEHYWKQLTENSDLAFFYATSPISGVIGYGLVRTKFRQNSPLWPDERAANEVIWPWRFEFDVLACLPQDRWTDDAVVREDLKTRARSGFQSLEAEIAQELIRALPSAAPLVLPSKNPVRSVPPSPVPAPTPVSIPVADLHAQAQAMLAEIGRLQRYVADTEYPIESRRLDVVWRRVQRSVPSYVFEVQVSGNLTEALGKLKQAHDLWNSNIFLVGKEEHRSPFTQLAGGTFHEIQDRLKFIELPQVEELYRRKRAFREFEDQIGILG